MKTIKTFSKVITLTIFCVIFFSACFSYWADSEGTIVINFGGTGRSYFDLNNDEYKDFIYEVYIRRSNSSTLTRVGEFEGGSGVVSAPVGRYTVILKAYEYENGNKGKLRGYGYSGNESGMIVHPEEVNISAGQSIEVDVFLFSAVGVSEWDDLVYAIGTAEESNNPYDARKLYIFINKDLDADSTAVIGGNITLIPEGNITIKSSGEINPYISYYGTIFAVGDFNDDKRGALTLGQNNTGGTLTLRGTEVLGGSLIIIDDGSLEMYDGVTISGNTAYYGGGVRVNGIGAFFYMHGGTISGNIARGSSDSSGGGVYVDNGIFYKFKGATIYGYDENDPNSNKVINEDNIPEYNRGHAVYARNSSGITPGEGHDFTYRFRDDTCRPDEMLFVGEESGGDWVVEGEDPNKENIEINSAADLAKIGREADYPLDGNYILTGPITLANNWTPIRGPNNEPFTGNFDGGNNKINFPNVPTRLQLSGGFNYIGLFGNIKGATVKNLELEGRINLELTNVAPSQSPNWVHMGTIAGESAGSEISNIMTNVTITVSSSGSGSSNNSSVSLYVGGVVGDINDSSITNCYSIGNININGVYLTGYIGGIAGMTRGNISNCISESIITSVQGSIVGGITGSLEQYLNENNINTNGQINNCVALNQSLIAPGSSVGRIAGSISGANFSNNYARGDMQISGQSNIQPAPDTLHGGNITSWDSDLFKDIGFTDEWWYGKLPTGASSGGIITIDTQPEPITNLFAGNSAELFIEASVTGGAANYQLSYQWYSSTTDSNADEEGIIIDEAGSPIFTIPATLAVGTYYYFCEVSATNDIQSVRSNVAVVNVEAPVITINTHPTPTTNLFAGNISGSLSVEAIVTGGAALSYQWYSNTTDSSIGGSTISGATSSSFTIPTLTAGTYYYYCQVTATGGATPVNSSIARINIVAPIEMIQVPGGSFELGRELYPAGGGWDYTPVSTVNISSFHMGKYQVTQEQYLAVMGTNPSGFSSNPASGEVQERRPVECVSWYDAIEFCNALSLLEGLIPYYNINKTAGSDTNNLNEYDPYKWLVTPNPSANGYRLPTEAQWEYAAKGGNGSPGNFTYSGSNDPDAVAWYTDNSGNRTHEVGKKAPNGLGIYDMSGNVWEWCWDWWGSYTSTTKTDPTGAVSGAIRVIRGGCWSDSVGYTRSAFRLSYYPSNRYNSIGFRLVRP